MPQSFTRMFYSKNHHKLFFITSAISPSFKHWLCWFCWIRAKMQTDSTALFLSNIIKLNLVLKEIQNNSLLWQLYSLYLLKLTYACILCPTFNVWAMLATDAHVCEYTKRSLLRSLKLPEHWKCLKSISALLQCHILVKFFLELARSLPSLTTLMRMMNLWRDLTRALTLWPLVAREVGGCGVWGPGVQHWQRCQVNAGLSLVNAANTGLWLVRTVRSTAGALTSAKRPKLQETQF